MRLSEDTNVTGNFIRAYENQRVQINHIWFDHSIIVTLEKIIDPWPPHSIIELQPAHFAVITALKPEIFLLGTGAQLQFPNTDLLAVLQTQHIGYEIMDTAAACRTYNVLMSEGRNVAAALLIA